MFFVMIVEATRALSRNKGRTGLTMLGITVAIAAVVWVVALGRESASQYTKLLSGLGDNLVWVEAGSRNAAGVRTGTHSANTLMVGDMLAIRREVPLIQRVSPQVDSTVGIISERSNWTTRARGVAPDYLAVKRFEIAQGDVFTDDDVEAAHNVVLLGETVRRRLFADEVALGQTVRVNKIPFVVIGILAVKGQSATGQDQDDAIMLPYTTALRNLRAPGPPWVDDIVCSAVSFDAVAKAADDITALIRERHHIAPGAEADFNIRHPEEIVKAQVESAETFATLLSAVAGVALLVGGIGIMNVMLASVTERTREIGLRLAVGAKQAAILGQFLAEAMLLSIWGGIAGVIVSIAGASLIGRWVGWKLSIPLDAVVVSISTATVVGVIFGFVPARRAARLDPIEALRGE